MAVVGGAPVWWLWVQDRMHSTPNINPTFVIEVMRHNNVQYVGKRVLDVYSPTLTSYLVLKLNLFSDEFIQVARFEEEEPMRAMLAMI